MEINWFTFGAQIVNFLVLVWLLKHFLYGPIVNAMAEREQRIADRFDEAHEKRESAEAEAAAYRQKQEELASVREDKLAEAEEEARERRREMIEEARTEAERLEQQWKDALRRERDTFLTNLAERASQKTVDLARRALADLAHADLEQQVIRVFIDRLRTLDGDRRQLLTDAVRSENGEVVVQTAFELDEEQRDRLIETVQEVTDSAVSPEVDRDGEVGFGIEVRAGGHKIAWSLQSYFAELDEEIRARIDAELSSGTPPADEPPSAVLEGSEPNTSGTDDP